MSMPLRGGPGACRTHPSPPPPPLVLPDVILPWPLRQVLALPGRQGRLDNLEK